MGIDQDAGCGGYWFKRWASWVYDVINCTEDNGRVWAHLPEDGGYYDQDETIMNIWETVRYYYIKMQSNSDVISVLEKKGKVNARS